MKPSVVVVGSFVQDLTFRCTDFPKPGETIMADFVTGPGGKGSNQAVAAARAGALTRFVGAVGQDTFAEAAATFHRDEHIDSRLVTKTTHPTATAGIVVNQSGENQIVVAIGASAQLRARDVPSSLLQGASVVVAQHESNLATNAHVFRIARKMGATTVLNPAPMRLDFDPSILRFVDVLIPNESEFVALVKLLPACAKLVRKSSFNGGADFGANSLPGLPADALQKLCRTFAVPVVIVTMGKHGCFISLTDRGEHLPGHAVEVVDSTGAGDAFVGGFAAGFVRYNGNPLLAAHFANAVAALSVTKPGTSPSMPKQNEIERFLRDAGAQRSPKRISSARRYARLRFS
jgi:ribokinase